MKKEALKYWVQFTVKCAVGGIIGGSVSIVFYKALEILVDLLSRLSRKSK